MYPRLNIYFDEGEGVGGGGPDEDPRFPSRTLRSHGFISLAFGFALGLTLMIVFGLFRFIFAQAKSVEQFIALENFIENANLNLWDCFLWGFIGGTLISAIYNFLIFQRLNLFGLDRNLD